MDARQIRVTEEGREIAQAIDAMEQLGATRAETTRFIITGRLTKVGLTEVTIRAKILPTRQGESGGSE